ncbi:MAG: hypothetical protein Q7U54_07345 [Bacteroidales bacterium]|nr:hypothetical protein [Bacteroidales bacterium]
MKITNIEAIKRLETFSTAFPGINSTSELVELTRCLLEAMFYFEYSFLYLNDSTVNRFNLHYSKGFNFKKTVAVESISRHHLSGLVHLSKEMIYSPDRSMENILQSGFENMPQEVQSQLYLPVMNGEIIVGVFGIADSEPDKLGDEETSIVRFICNLLGAKHASLLYQNTLKSVHEEVLTLSKLPAENPNPVLRVSRDRVLLYANKASEKLLKYHKFKVGDKVNHVFVKGISKVLQSQKAIEHEISDGKSIYLFLFTKAEGTDYINLFGRDITRRKSLENELKKIIGK